MTNKKVQIRENIEMVQSSRNVLTIYVSNIKSGWELTLLNRSDAHHDSKYCNRELEKKHLDQALEKDALILDYGDNFDAMQGKYDPRRSYDDLRPEYVVSNYMDEIVIDDAKFLAPYAKNFVLMGPGNHEKDVLKNNGVDLTSNLVHRLNSDHGGHISTGCYGGYVRFIFNSGRSTMRTIKYFHGASLAMSRALVNKQATIYPDADIIVNGHAHDAWYVPVARERLSERGVVTRDIQHQFRTASYKDDYGDGGDGWAVERGNGPSILGAVWIKFMFKNHNIETEIRQDVQ